MVHLDRTLLSNGLNREDLHRNWHRTPAHWTREPPELVTCQRHAPPSLTQRSGHARQHPGNRDFRVASLAGLPVPALPLSQRGTCLAAGRNAAKEAEACRKRNLVRFAGPFSRHRFQDDFSDTRRANNSCGAEIRTCVEKAAFLGRSTSAVRFTAVRDISAIIARLCHCLSWIDVNEHNAA